MKKFSVGYATGVFDLFHVGHLNLLRRAKDQCEYLIIGVTTDELVEIRKNKTPVIPYNERVEIVSSIKYVDKVVPQENMDKFGAWENLKFDVVFVGDDWKGSPSWIKYEEEFNSVGVSVIYFPYTAGTSSTILTETIKKIYVSS
ncbi:adenylyltransferase/cytidyltransferase family protein [Bacillus salacetis]|uniref:adenylyltransferase/cytidyltransferase family protein n=1 Tax=Bacillus salacetis TaxID=2315464 RepID=UPI003B9F60B5